ncbi:Fanconi anaemia protein FancD2 nuclease-domain-containing protein [Entophlyctis helioformis]|nr:Fanconi anaemia protein FancD2 nuclease-domain-containing protein [Entophlyctis helioformis]
MLGNSGAASGSGSGGRSRSAATQDARTGHAGNVFVQLVQEAGLQPSANVEGGWRLVGRSPFGFGEQLQRLVRDSASSLEAAIDRFMGGFDALLDDPDMLVGLLSEVGRDETQGTLARASAAGAGVLQQTSAVRMLLSVDILQPHVIRRLVERLAEFTGQNRSGQAGANIPKMIIKQLRWLDHVWRPDEMVDKLIEVLQVSATEIQIEIIGSIPEIVVDSAHQRISLCLIETMNQSPELTNTILDTLTSLTMDDDSLATVREACIAKLESADLDALPVILRFLLQLITPDTAVSSIKRIRIHLDMDAVAQILAIEANDIEEGRSKGKKPERQLQTLLLESIRTSFQARPFLQDAWMRIISDVESAAMLRPLDMLVLIVIYSLSTSHRKKSQIAIKRKAMGGELTPSLIKRTIASHGSSIQSFFPSILGIADYMMSTALECCHSLCIELYIHLFNTSDAYGRQQVIGSLVTHIGTGIEFNIGASLGILLELSRTVPETVTPFSIFIKSILDYLDQLGIANIRKLFEVLSNLAMLSDSESFDATLADQVISFESSLLTDLHIVIRKQLGSVERKYKQIGVLGSVVLIQKLAAKDKMSQHALKQAQQIYETTVSSCRQSLSCLCMVYDELAFLVAQGRLHERFIKWLRKRIFDSFITLFLFDDAETKDACDLIESAHQDSPRQIQSPDKWMELEKCDCAVRLYPLALRLVDVAQVQDKTHEPDATADLATEPHLILLLCSKFKLVQACERVTTRAEDNPLNLLLGAGLVLFARKDANELNVEMDPAGRHALCSSLFQAINWLREILNCFSGSADEATARQCLVRVGHILEIERYLQSLLHSLPGWIPPSLIEEVSSHGRPVREQPVSTVCITTAGLLADDADAFMTPETSPVKPRGRFGGKAGGTKSGGKAKTMPTLWDMGDLRPLMREFDLSVFGLLVHDSAGDDDGDGAALTPTELEFLLSDLVDKVEFHFGQRSRAGVTSSVSAAGPSAGPGSSSASVIGTAAGGGNSGGSVTGTLGGVGRKAAKVGRAEVELIGRLSARAVFTKIVDILPGICMTLEKIGNGLRELIGDDEDAVVGVVDQPLLNVFELIMRMLAMLLRWPSLQDTTLKDERRQFLHVLSSRTLLVDASSASLTHEQMVAGAFDYVARFEKCLVTGEAAASLQTVLVAMYDLAPASEPMLRKLQFFSKSFVCRSWRDGSSMKPEKLMYLIGQHIAFADDAMLVLEDYFTKAFSALATKDEDTLMDFPLLNRQTFLSFYKAVFTALCQQVQRFSSDASTGADGEAEAAIGRLSACFAVAVKLVQRFEQSQVIAVILKQARVFLQAYIKRVIPVLNREFRKSKDGIIQILRMVQTGTRLLQSVCNETKVAKENSPVAASVPPLRRVLEAFVYEVKKMLADNNSLQAFSIGNLKHRAITGEEISSQIPNIVSPQTQDRSDSEDDEERRPSKKGKRPAAASSSRGTSRAGKKRSKKAQEDIQEEQEEEEEVEEDEEIIEDGDEDEPSRANQSSVHRSRSNMPVKSAVPRQHKKSLVLYAKDGTAVDASVVAKKRRLARRASRATPVPEAAPQAPAENDVTPDDDPVEDDDNVKEPDQPVQDGIGEVDEPEASREEPDKQEQQDQEEDIVDDDEEDDCMAGASSPAINSSLPDPIPSSSSSAAALPSAVVAPRGSGGFSATPSFGPGVAISTGSQPPYRRIPGLARPRPKDPLGLVQPSSSSSSILVASSSMSSDSGSAAASAPRPVAALPPRPGGLGGGLGGGLSLSQSTALGGGNLQLQRARRLGLGRRNLGTGPSLLSQPMSLPQGVSAAPAKPVFVGATAPPSDQADTDATDDCDERGETEAAAKPPVPPVPAKTTAAKGRKRGKENKEVEEAEPATAKPAATRGKGKRPAASKTVPAASKRSRRGQAYSGDSEDAQESVEDGDEEDAPKKRGRGASASATSSSRPLTGKRGRRLKLVDDEGEDDESVDDLIAMMDDDDEDQDTDLDGFIVDDEEEEEAYRLVDEDDEEDEEDDDEPPLRRASSARSRAGSSGGGGGAGGGSRSRRRQIAAEDSDDDDDV